MIMEGWIKIHRRILDWEWFTEPNTMLVFLYLLLTARREAGCWKGVELQPGQCVVGRAKISMATGLSERKVRTSLERLEKTKEVTIKSTNRFSIITICKYDDYQMLDDIDQPATRPTNDQQTTNHQTRMKEINNKEENILSKDNIKEESKPSRIFRKPTVEQVAVYCKERNNTIDAQSFVDFYDSKGWVVGKSPMKDWKAAVRTWEQKRINENIFNGGMNTGVILKEKPKYTEGW